MTKLQRDLNKLKQANLNYEKYGLTVFMDFPLLNGKGKFSHKLTKQNLKGGKK